MTLTRPFGLLAGLLLSVLPTMSMRLLSEDYQSIDRSSLALMNNPYTTCEYHHLQLRHIAIGPDKTWHEAHNIIAKIEACNETLHNTREFTIDIRPQEEQTSIGPISGQFEENHAPRPAYAVAGRLAKVLEHMTNLEKLMIHLPPEDLRSFWYAFHPDAFPSHILAAKDTFPDQKVILKSVKRLAVPPSLDWLRDHCPNLEKIARYKTGEHRQQPDYKSADKCSLTPDELPQVQIFTRMEWDQAQGAVARLEPCINALHKTRQLFVNFNMHQMNGCEISEGEAPPEDLPVRLVRLIKAMSGLEKAEINFTRQHSKHFEDAWANMAAEDEEVRDKSLFAWQRRMRQRDWCPRVNVKEVNERSGCIGVWDGYVEDESLEHEEL